MKTRHYLRARVLFLLVSGVALVLVAGKLDEGMLNLLSAIAIWGIVAIGFDLVFGLAGLLSFGHAAFLGIGAYVFAITAREGAGFLPALALAGAGGGASAYLFARIALRATGLHFSLLTLALAQLTYIAAGDKLRHWTGGRDGIPGVPRPDFLGIDFHDGRAYLVFVSILLVLALLLAAIIRRSPFGHALAACRDDAMRAAQIGFDVRALRSAAMAISGAFAGIGGALLASLASFAGPQMLHWTLSGDVVIMTLLGGRNTLFGPLLGAAAVEILRDKLALVTPHWHGLLGLLFAAVTIGLPNGLAGVLRAKPRAGAKP